MAQLYKDFQPTAFDNRSNFMAHGDIDYLAEWLVVPCGRHRDSRLVDESNFEAALAMLGGESDEVEVHRFGHWACGWYELILVSPNLAAKVDEIEGCIEQYPLLDEDLYYRKVLDAAYEYWQHASVRERVEIIQNNGNGECNIFAARRDELPRGINEEEMIGEY